MPRDQRGASVRAKIIGNISGPLGLLGNLHGISGSERDGLALAPQDLMLPFLDGRRLNQSGITTPRRANFLHPLKVELGLRQSRLIGL
eukprot:9732815-Alexandrium_andersonii.AAC.1